MPLRPHWSLRLRAGQPPSRFGTAVGGAEVELGLLLAALGRGVAVGGGASGAAVAGPLRMGSLPRPRPAIGDGAGVLAETLDLITSTNAVAGSGPGSTNRQDTRYFDGYWSRFCGEQNTSRLRNS